LVPIIVGNTVLGWGSPARPALDMADPISITTEIVESSAILNFCKLEFYNFFFCSVILFKIINF